MSTPKLLTKFHYHSFELLLLNEIYSAIYIQKTFLFSVFEATSIIFKDTIRNNCLVTNSLTSDENRWYMKHVVYCNISKCSMIDKINPYAIILPGVIQFGSVPILKQWIAIVLDF